MDNIRVERFKFKHLSMLMEMLEDQKFKDIGHVSMKTLPKIGFIALIDNVPIAAGFLRRVECDVVAQIDTLCSNPYFGSIIRHNGISRTVEALIEEAKHLKLKGVYAFTADDSVLARAEAIGFHKVNQAVIALPFKGD